MTKMLISLEAAERLGIRPRDVYCLIDQGELPAYKGERGLIVISVDDLDRYQSGYETSG